MHAPDLPTRLRALGLTRRGFARLIADLAGADHPKYRTVEDWGNRCPTPDPALALLALLERVQRPDGAKAAE